jgi:hypothetical protein
LKQANDDATQRHNELLTAIDPASRVEDYISNFEISTSNSGASESSSQSYAVVDKTGAIISEEGRNDDLALKSAKITRLINEIEETQKEIAEVIDHSGIWEKFVGTNEHHHFRHTKISTHPKMPGIESVRSLASEQYPIEHQYEINVLVRGAKLTKLFVRITDMYIALMGAVGAGKSTFVNVCCDENLAPISQGPGHCRKPQTLLFRRVSNCYIYY